MSEMSDTTTTEHIHNSMYPPQCNGCGVFVDSDNPEIEVEVRSAHYPYRREWVSVCGCCEDDLPICADCDERFAAGAEMTDIDERSICPRCIEDYYRCDTCNDWVHAERVHSDLHGEGTYCYICAPRRDCRVHSYSYKPQPKFYGEGPLYFGCELEVNCDHEPSAADWFMDRLGENRIYLKEDGSLSTGFEIVSHPHSFTEALKLWSNVNPSAPATSYESGECGFHVHVSRNALTKFQIQKLVVFVNAPENYEFITHIAQREGNGFSKYKTKKIGMPESGDRYEAVNLENKNTIEFRIFRGTLKTERLLKNIEFCHAAIHWVSTASYRELTHEKFSAYVTANRKLYKNLWLYLQPTKTEKGK